METMKDIYCSNAENTDATHFKLMSRDQLNLSLNLCWDDFI